MKCDYNQWFGQRVKEIMDEKGLTVLALSEQTNIGRMTITRILKGRYATAEEVEQLAEAFGVTPSRLRQKEYDLQAIYEQIEIRKENLEALIEELNGYLEIALGKTEKGNLYLQLGMAHFHLKEMQKATAAWRQSYHILKDHEDLRLRFEGYLKLMIGYGKLARMDEVDRLILEALPQFEGEPGFEGQMLKFKAYYHNNQKQHDLAIEAFQKAVDYYKKENNIDELTFLYHNLGEVEFSRGRYDAAKRYYQMVYEAPRCNRASEMILFKDYAKVLLCLGETKQALAILETIMDEILEIDSPQVANGALFLYAILKQDPAIAERIPQMPYQDDRLNIAAHLLAAMLREPNFQLEAFLPTLRTVLQEYALVG